ncbi:MAG: site-specific integrase [Candidatus Tectomicrobia bacterium]|nr:site-specific integrase [Candidatus Tectomicrobia bacterium]
MTPIAPHISDYLRDRLPHQRGASPHTCVSYAYSFQLLFEFASRRFGLKPSELTLEQIDAPLVMDFLASLETERDNCPATRNVRLAAIKSFMHFVEYRVPALLEQSRQILAIPKKKTDQPLIHHLSLTEMQAILNAPNLQKRVGIRDRAMLHVCFAAGLRVSELLSLPMTALTWQPTPTLYIEGKGRRHRALPIWKQTAEDVRAWLAVRGDVPVPELFVSAQGRAMTRMGFTYVLRKYVQLAMPDCLSLQEKHVTPHVLRHTCAMMIYQATGDLRKVSLWLGHADMQATEVYVRADPTEKLDAIEAAIPPELRRGQFTVPDRLIAMLHDQ